MARELNEAPEAFRFDPAVRVLLRDSNGHFCAGGNVPGMKRRVDALAQGVRPETDTHATDLFMTGRRFTTKDAEQWNLITRAVPADELEATVKKQVTQLAAGLTCSYAEIKAAINRIVYPNLYQVMAPEADCAERLTHTTDHAEAVNAFLEKRRPVFSGT